MKVKYYISGICTIFHTASMYAKSSAIPRPDTSFILNTYGDYQQHINGLLAIATGYFVVIKRKNLVDRKFYRKIIKNLESDQNNTYLDSKAVTNQIHKKINADSHTAIYKSYYTSMEKRIVEGLINLEESNQFLNREINLDVIQSELNVEFKYLEQIILKHYSTSASLYIHLLRINYITKKMYLQIKLREYKSADLASICGYSSAGEFESYFQKINKISLKNFLQRLKKDEEKKNRKSLKVA